MQGLCLYLLCRFMFTDFVYPAVQLILQNYISGKQIVYVCIMLYKIVISFFNLKRLLF